MLIMTVRGHAAFAFRKISRSFPVSGEESHIPDNPAWETTMRFHVLSVLKICRGLDITVCSDADPASLKSLRKSMLYGLSCSSLKGAVCKPLSVASRVSFHRKGYIARIVV